MATEKLISLSEVKKKLTAVRQYFSGPPSTEQDKLARSVVKLCMEEVGKIKPVDAVVLPCGYGKTIYAVGNKKIVECEIDEISFGVVGLMYLVSFDCDSDCDGCPFNSWKQDYSGEWSCDGEYNQAAVKGCDFGKTVFLTREEAEQALGKMNGEGSGNDGS